MKMDAVGIMGFGALAVGVIGLTAMQVAQKVHRRRVNGAELDQINRHLTASRRTRLCYSRNSLPPRDTEAAQITLHMTLLKDTPLQALKQSLEQKEASVVPAATMRLYFPDQWDRYTEPDDPSRSSWTYFTRVLLEVE